VSSRFVRYVLVPWSENLGNSREELAFARHRLISVYGEETERWEIRLSPGGAGEARVASAVDPDLLGELKNAFPSSRLRTSSIQPYLMTAYNFWRKRLGSGGSRMLLLAEHQLYTCAAFRGEKWSNVHTVALHGNLMDNLPVILDRESVWSAFEEQPAVFVYAPEQPDLSPSPAAAWKINTLRLQPRRGFSPLSDAQYGMAMTLA
jgi:hypothetical protein